MPVFSAGITAIPRAVAGLRGRMPSPLLTVCSGRAWPRAALSHGPPGISVQQLLSLLALSGAGGFRHQPRGGAQR